MELRCARQWPGYGRPVFMITAGFRGWEVASQIRKGWPGRLCVPPADGRVDGPAL